MLAVYIDNWFLNSHLFVHVGLSEHGLVQFVVAVSTVADKVHHYVSFESLPEFECKFENLVDLIRFIGVNMENRCFNDFRDFCAVETTATVFGDGCESDLVVYNDVYDSSGAIAL